MKEFAELKYQLEGLKNAIAVMETGITGGDIRYIKSQMRYFKEKSERVLSEAEVLINENEQW